MSVHSLLTAPFSRAPLETIHHSPILLFGFHNAPFILLSCSRTQCVKALNGMTAYFGRFLRLPPPPPRFSLELFFISFHYSSRGCIPAHFIIYIIPGNSEMQFCSSGACTRRGVCVCVCVQDKSWKQNHFPQRADQCPSLFHSSLALTPSSGIDYSLHSAPLSLVQHTVLRPNNQHGVP